VFLGVILAYLFNPILRMCEKHIFRFKAATKSKKNLKRGLSLILTYIIILIILTIFILLIIPQLYLSFTDLASKMNGYIDSTLKWLDDFFSKTNFFGVEINSLNDALDRLFELFDINIDNFGTKLTELITNSSNLIKDFAPIVFSYFSGIANGFLNTIIGVIFSLYFLSSKEKLTAQCKKLLRSVTSQKAYNSVLELANFSDKTFGGFITGKILDSIIIGILCFIICAICKMPYALLVSTFVGITNIIPVVGPFIGAIPGTFIIFIVDPQKAFWFILIDIILQQLDGNFIGPKILGQTTGLSALWVLLSITIMGGLWGLLGMLLAVPVFAILYSLLKIAVEKRLSKRELSPQTVDYYADVEDRQFSSEDEPHSFAANINRLTADIAGNHFGERFKKFRSRVSDKRKDKKNSKSSDNDDSTKNK
ncbi:MAG: AI-2E family transporter, partial [Clostridiales bacterium]|nr:AI-2E family transporter [Clostridiales bacterium]